MENELISVIVPIYNVENYLRMCLDSIQNQTYTNFECLLINDGSPDSSAEICREYVDKDSRFRYFEKENGGVSSARNLGMKCANGDYITFVDPDDWIDPDYLEILYLKMMEYDADVAIATYKKYSVSDGCYYFHVLDQDYYEKIYTGDELLAELPYRESFDSTFNVSWGKLFKRSLLYSLVFNEQRVMGEDLEFNFKVFLRLNKCLYIHKPLYNFRRHDSSACARMLTDKDLVDDLEIRMERIPYLLVRNIDPQIYIEKTKEFLKVRIQYKEALGIENTNGIQIYEDVVRYL